MFENLAPLIHSTDDIEAIAGAPLLGRIPDIKTRQDHRKGSILLNDGAVQSPAGEAFRALSANLLALAPEAPSKTTFSSKRKSSVPPISGLFSEAQSKTILISSAEPRAGKTTVLVNLAAAMAQAGRQVIVVDGDLRNPSVHQVFDLAREPGLSDMLLHPSHLGSAVQDTKVEGVRVVASGSWQTDPAVVLNAPALQQVIQKLAAEADIVLWDSPPILAAADAAVLAPTVDGVLLVVRTQARREPVQAACRQLASVKAKLIGAVMNRTEQGVRYYHHQTPASQG